MTTTDQGPDRQAHNASDSHGDEFSVVGQEYLFPARSEETLMTTTTPTIGDDDLHGPVDFVLIEFPGDRLSGEASAALCELMEQGVIRLYDLVVIGKTTDGTVAALEVSDPAVESFDLYGTARSGLLSEQDVREAAEAMEPGTVAALIVFENTWAAPFVHAVRNSGGELVASARIAAADVIAALETVDAAHA